MRALSACLVAVLALGTAALTACSSTSSDDSSGGGTGGSSAGTTSGGSGGASAGATSGGSGGASAGSSAMGEAGASCVLMSDACITCLGGKCQDQEQACVGDQMTCEPAFNDLGPCVCEQGKSVADCEAQFKTAGGSKASDLTDCFDTNCATVCAQ